MSKTHDTDANFPRRGGISLQFIIGMAVQVMHPIKKSNAQFHTFGKSSLIKRQVAYLVGNAKCRQVQRSEQGRFVCS